ncbi:MAG: PHP domain-containing protein, partial [Myxococcota bacterium]
MIPYAPLWCKSNFSFLEGASHPDELVEAASLMGLSALALTDRDGVYGAVRAHVRAKEVGLQLIHGAQLTVEDQSQIVLLAQSRTGYSQLCQLLSKGRLRSPKGESKVRWDEICEHSEDLIALWGGEQSLIAAPADPSLVANRLREAFGDRLYMVLTRHRRAIDIELEQRIRERARIFERPIVVANEVLYHTAGRRPLQDILTCIRHRTSLSDAGRLIRPNDEFSLKNDAQMR